MYSGNYAPEVAKAFVLSLVSSVPSSTSVEGKLARGEDVKIIDDKGRIIIPTALRPFFENGIVMPSPVEDREIVIIPPEHFDDLRQELKDHMNAGRIEPGAAYAMERQLWAKSDTVTSIDPQGRWVIPQRYRQLLTAGAEAHPGAVIIEGCGNHVAIRFFSEQKP